MILWHGGIKNVHIIIGIISVVSIIIIIITRVIMYKIYISDFSYFET